MHLQLGNVVHFSPQWSIQDDFLARESVKKMDEKNFDSFNVTSVLSHAYYAYFQGDEWNQRLARQSWRSGSPTPFANHC